MKRCRKVIGPTKKRMTKNHEMYMMLFHTHPAVEYTSESFWLNSELFSNLHIMFFGYFFYKLSLWKIIAMFFLSNETTDFVDC